MLELMLLAGLAVVVVGGEGGLTQRTRFRQRWG